MKSYIGIKLVKAEPEDQDGESGYKVQYPDGYTSWCPQEQFESANTHVPDLIGERLVHHLRTVLHSLRCLFS